MTTWNSLFNRDPSKVRDMIQQTLTRWRSNTDFAGLRDPAALEMLPAEELAAYLELWRDVGVLSERAEKAK